ncbi:MAG: glycosyltransferase [Elusimicrobia bacterium]|nr:glycosyltransferase [Elusimicrobiota bacterium]
MRGGERQLLYLAGYLRGQGHRNVIVCRAASPLAREAQRLGFITLFLPFAGEWDPLSAFLLRRHACRAEGSVLLHAHTAHTASLAFLASRFSGPAWVCHRRVDFSLSNPLTAKIKYAKAGRIIAVSEAIRALLINEGIAEDRVEVVHDCLPLNEEEARAAGVAAPMRPVTPAERLRLRRRFADEWSVSPDDLWIGNVAALVAHKNQADLLRAFALLIKEEPRALLFLLGEGPLRGGLTALAQKLGVQDRVRLTGHRKDAVEWLQCLDVFALSSWGEGMGSVLLEAMACALPIVATTAGGISEVLGADRTGLLCPPRDPRRLSEAILWMLRHRETAREYARNAALVLENFSLTRCGREVEKIYDGALSSAWRRN